MPIDQARQLLGEAFIIGGTANTFEDVVQHYRAGADYLASVLSGLLPPKRI